jgi:exodeoxyribonuclease VII small subunit
MKKQSIPSYEAAWKELQQILADIQSEQIGIDELGDKVARANELIEYCRERLRKTEEGLEQLDMSLRR